MAPRGARARLQADIQALAAESYEHIDKIGKGDTEEEFVVTFSHPNLRQIDIRILPQEPSGYPSETAYLVYTNHEIPNEVANVLDGAMTETSGMLVKDMLKKLTKSLIATLDPSTSESDEDVEMTDIDAESNDQLDDFDDFDDLESEVSFKYNIDDNLAPLNDITTTTGLGASERVLQRLCQDFQTARKAGFRVAKICGLDETTGYGIATVSLKASKLGLSDETLDAWNLASSDYISIILRYVGKYLAFEDVTGQRNLRGQLEFKVRKCTRYRPTASEAVDLFQRQSRPQGLTGGRAETSSSEPKLSSFPIGESIDLLLESNFAGISNSRYVGGVDWDAALESASTIRTDESASASMKPTSRSDAALPAILQQDHFQDEGTLSLPLVVAQFVFQYLIKCTKYCMICHKQVASNFEAIKPFVCADRLCLFQYMNLGLGPSIDHEIVSQPYVVDLLISFCYGSLRYTPGFTSPAMREFPFGLDLQVPQIKPLTIARKAGNNPRLQHTVASNVAEDDHPISLYGFMINPLEVRVDWDTATVTMLHNSQIVYHGLKTGQWVAIHTSKAPEGVPAEAAKSSTAFRNANILHHAYITFIRGPKLEIKVSSRHNVPMTLLEKDPAEDIDWTMGYNTAHLMPYTRSFDGLTAIEDRAFSLSLLLRTLPPVSEMRSYLKAGRHRQLATWDRISPSAMKLLRWIVASNRSFIVQVDKVLSQDETSNQIEDQPVRDLEKIDGVEGWIQFRFAQGSAEKENLFRESLKTVAKEQRSLVAWHGSPIENWHSIIREGLDFEKVGNGRAYGDGVYFSRSFDYSQSYSRGMPQEGIWPQSALKIERAISLNELVNLPEQFVHSQACFVVNILHWIQCRYLFVCPKNQIPYHNRATASRPQVPQGTSSGSIPAQGKKDPFVQDRNFVTTGPNNAVLSIPRTAFASGNQTPTLSRLVPSTNIEQNNTDEEDVEDTEWLDMMGRARGKQEDSQPALPPTPTYESFTDFRPGHLDFSLLPQLAFPSYATNAAQKTLQKELQKLEKVQSSTPLHELGWYMDFDRIENMFQWIVELHTFDASLPLAKDMKNAGVTSIVLEIRFLRGFPLTPPFVRVVRPRFLPFANGGGGHVTAGGAMCMELLTNTGWSPANSLENVILQVRLAMCSMDPRPARLLTSGHDNKDQYGIGEAVDAYRRAAAMHGWEVPKELQEATKTG